MQYILIHGAWQGGWCFEPLATILRELGATVSCPDLPGHGSNPVPVSTITYQMYYDSLVKELHTYTEPVILVAHSMSGILAAPLLDHYSDRISHLFLISAFVAQNGKSLLDIAMAGGPSEIPRILLTDEKNQTQSLDLSKVKNALYHDCPSELADWAICKLQPQPIAPFTTPINWVDSGKTRNKRTYILCENDRDVHQTTQHKIIEDYPCRVVTLQSGHFPFLSQPRQLAAILTDV